MAVGLDCMYSACGSSRFLFMQLKIMQIKLYNLHIYENQGFIFKNLLNLFTGNFIFLSTNENYWFMPLSYQKGHTNHRNGLKWNIFC